MTNPLSKQPLRAISLGKIELSQCLQELAVRNKRLQLSTPAGWACEIKQFSVSRRCDQIEVTSLGSTHKEFVAGPRREEISARAYVTCPSLAPVGELIDINFNCDGRVITGKVLLMSASTSFAPGELAICDMLLVGVGPMTVTEEPVLDELPLSDVSDLPHRAIALSGVK